MGTVEEALNGGLPSQVYPLRVSDLVPAARNPNRMDEARYRGLVESIRLTGDPERKLDLQPVLVRPLFKTDGTATQFEIVDGHHRVKAHVELGIEHISAIVREMSDAEAEAARVALSRNRGETDLLVVADVMHDLVAAGWDSSRCLMTGFSESEQADLLASLEPVDPLADSAIPSVDPEPNEKPAKVFTLELVFDTKEQLKVARRKLRKAAGKGGSLGTGLLKVLGEE